MENEETLNQIKELEEKLSLAKDFDTKADIMDELLRLKKIILPPKPPESHYECEGCSA